MIPGAAIPPALARGDVRAWHILLLYALMFMSVAVASIKLSSSVDPLFRLGWQLLLMQALTAFFVAIVTLVVPELRRSLPVLFARPSEPLTGGDFLLCLALMLAWCFGAHRVLVLFPLLQWNPALFGVLGFTESWPRVGATALFSVAAATVALAPLAEELVFRGFLLNLWRQRWGTWAAVLLSSALFGAVHFQFGIFAGGMGVLFALVYLRSGSLWPGTLLHAGYNLLVGPWGLAPLFSEKSRADAASLSGWVPEMALAFAFVPLAFLFWRRFRPLA
jgi:membrane protease YdiL (CAAX protease family)